MDFLKIVCVKLFFQHSILLFTIMVNKIKLRNNFFSTSNVIDIRCHIVKPFRGVEGRGYCKIEVNKR